MREVLLPLIVALALLAFVLFAMNRAIDHNVNQLTPTPTFVEGEQ